MQKRETAVIVLHEIYGMNEHIKNVCKLFESQGFDAICPNFIEKNSPFSYEEEEIAYRHFMNNIGFKKAAGQIKRLLLNVKEKYKKVYLVGFSVGATIAWKCSDDRSVDGVVGFYGSIIRDFVEIEPTCPVMLFFPEKEDSFHVDDLVTSLQKKNIEVYQLTGNHGFTDPYSPNFQKHSAQQAYKKVSDFLRQ